MKQVKQLLRYPVILVFFLFLFGYTLFDLTQTDREYSEFENKYLAQKPPFTMKAFLNNEWTQDYEEYINDQFVLRDDWITLKSVCESMLLKIENNGIAYGEDGYMFEKFTTFSGDQRAQYDRNLGYAMTFLNNHQNDNVTFAIIPNAYAIMPEKLPAGLEQIDQLGLIQEAYAQAPESAGIVDFSGTLTEHKDEYIYYRTDHHWTTLGAYYAYAQLMQQLGQEPVALSELDGKTVENFYGTYFSKAKKFDAQADTITYYEIPDAGVTIDGKEQDGYYDFSKFEVRDKYAAFLRGNNGYTVIKSGVRTVEEGQEPSRILIIKDSYANSFAPFLLYNYDEVHIVDLRYLAGSLSQLINEGGFDEILLMYNFSNLVTDTNLYKLGY